MKRQLIFSFLLSGLIAMPFGVAHADTNEVGTANINVVAPSTNALTLEQEPDIKFGAVKNTGQLSYDSISTESYKVLDLRGQANASYQIQAEISDFTATNSKKVLPMKQFLMSVGDSSDGAVKGNKDVNVYKVIGTVAQGTANSQRLEETGAVSAKLSLTSFSGVQLNDEYTATLTHRIVAGV